MPATEQRPAGRVWGGQGETGAGPAPAREVPGGGQPVLQRRRGVGHAPTLSWKHKEYHPHLPHVPDGPN